MVSFPRFTRPHSVVISHKLDEDNAGNEVAETVSINYVKFDENYGMLQSQRGIDVSDDALCIIDMNDLYAIKNGIRCNYISSHKYIVSDVYFTISIDDIIMFDDKEYTVTSINEINPFGRNPIYIEVRANAS